MPFARGAGKQEHRCGIAGRQHWMPVHIPRTAAVKPCTALECFHAQWPWFAWDSPLTCNELAWPHMRLFSLLAFPQPLHTQHVLFLLADSIYANPRQHLKSKVHFFFFIYWDFVQNKREFGVSALHLQHSKSWHMPYVHELCSRGSSQEDGKGWHCSLTKSGSKPSNTHEIAWTLPNATVRTQCTRGKAHPALCLHVKSLTHRKGLDRLPSFV